MASTTASSSTASSSTTPEEPRPQAGPLPLKRGEIGYREEQHEPVAEEATSEPALPARHPADRENTSSESDNSNATTTTSTDSSSPTPSASTNSIKKFLKPKKISYGGIMLSTLLAFVIQLIMIGGTIAAWVVSTLMLNKRKKESQESQGGDTMTQAAVSSTIFIHVVFTIAMLGQLLFLERRVFRLRAERYAHFHPGEILPTSRRFRNMDPSVGLSPWNRPPLPTYAAALAQSGVGTGDVEDHIIAQPPPPAYGNTRGSTLLLSGFLRNSLRAQRPASETSQTRSDRPVSYRSTDEEWEVVQDIDRARRLEETLARLERPRSRN
ncbi:hypothetical protein VNI00_014863 [Paramarasmius palmivorus]|uniref:Uncharacterized protein n=1 Tax=Paramarasmius palmivorus TaxID=297713 RepID=A0AAW0BTY9_9AGAR